MARSVRTVFDRMGLIVHLNGWPGVGKQTIGRLLAERLGARFVHNHLLHDVAIGCTAIGDPARWPLYETVRAAAYAALAGRAPSEVFVMTNALCRNSARERAAWSHVVELAIRRGAPLVPVVLEAEPDELLRRVQAPERAGRKLTDARMLAAMLTADDLQRPSVSECFAVDVTRLAPAAAAEEVERRLRARLPDLAPATPAHLQLV